MDRDQTKHQVLAATDLIQLVSEQVALKARGKEFIGVCPFHDDSNPSMYVSPAKQIYKCFACGAGGDAFSFVMGYHKMSFPESLEFLAERANIQLPDWRNNKSGDKSSNSPSPRKVITLANQQAVDFFANLLKDPKAGADARDYIQKRGISDEMVEAFKIGYAPDSWDGLTKHIRAQRLNQKAFETAGLIAARTKGDGHYDRLRHRLVFPILDGIGRAIAFGGRKLREEDEPKYLNSPETPLFNKSATLFGLHRAQKPIIDARAAVIVEGYTDVIACHQSGVNNAVATLGTALTREHAQVLRRYCDKVYLVFDPDEAGQKAADRALEVFFNEQIDIFIAILPAKLDPADLLAKNDGLQQWEQVLNDAVDAMTFQFNRVQHSFHQADSLTAKQRISEDYLTSLVRLGLRKLSRERYGLVFARIADLLGMTPGGVKEALKKIAQQEPQKPRAARPQPRQQQNRQQATPQNNDGPPVYDPGLEAIENANVELDFGQPGDFNSNNAPSNTPNQAVPQPNQTPGPVDATQRAERHIIGCIMNQPALFNEHMPDGRPLCESVVSGEFTDQHAATIYHAITDWLWEHDTMGAADLRDVFKTENILQGALEMQLNVDRLTDSNDERLLDLVIKCATFLNQKNAEQEYRLQKTEPNAAPDAGQRLLLAATHSSTNPSSIRMPRPIGQ